MSSLKSRFVLKCWSFYNSCKTRMDIEKTARAWKIALTVLITVGGSLLILFSIPLWPDDPTGILVFLSFQPFALLIALIWVKGKRKPIAALLVGSLVLFLFFTDVVLEINQTRGPEVINVTPNINTDEYLPFKWNSKIVKLKNASLQLTRKDDL
ncbi:MAG: hypothetical protein IJX19_07565, partial [Clostridia bacterium]|nr:hypothetical protein [Clostridia bacterium]